MNFQAFFKRWKELALFALVAGILEQTFMLMIFYVFAMQCISTIAIVKRETNGWRWPLFQLAYMTATAYLLALLVFQVGSRI